MISIAVIRFECCENKALGLHPPVSPLQDGVLGTDVIMLHNSTKLPPIGNNGLPT